MADLLSSLDVSSLMTEGHIGVDQISQERRDWKIVSTFC
jgi:hypothetical protein